MEKGRLMKSERERAREREGEGEEKKISDHCSVSCGLRLFSIANHRRGVVT
jgi:hypothetical protein